MLYGYSFIVNHQEKNEIDLDSLKKDHEEFIKKQQIKLKSQQRFKSKGQFFFTEEINKIALSSNDDEIMQSIDLIEI